MAAKTIAGKSVQVNDEGYMINPAEWTREIAAEMAKEEGIAVDGGAKLYACKMSVDISGWFWSHKKLQNHPIS